MFRKFFIFLAPLVFLFATGCAFQGTEAKNPVVQAESAPPFTQTVNGSSSFFISAPRIEKGKLYMSRGMAVAVSSEKNQCILLSNKHVIQDSKTIKATPWSGKPCQADSCREESTTVEAEIIAESPNVDAVLLRIEKQGGCNVSKLNNAEQEIGKSISAFGQPLESTGAMTRGIISGFWQTEDQGLLMVSDVLTTPGYSGSGVFDEQQQVIGLISGKTRDEKKGFAYIIPVSRLLPLLHSQGLF
jgi:S1-C subfamily serine protease